MKSHWTPKANKQNEFILNTDITTYPSLSQKVNKEQLIFFHWWYFHIIKVKFEYLEQNNNIMFKTKGIEQNKRNHGYCL